MHLSLDGIDIAMHSDEKVHIDGMNAESGIHIDVRRREKILDSIDLQACLFLNLATHALFNGLIHVTETSRQVEGSLGGFFSTTNN
jgi:hypothetical protein